MGGRGYALSGRVTARTLQENWKTRENKAKNLKAMYLQKNQ
jgi:hypothetical protein